MWCVSVPGCILLFVRRSIGTCVFAWPRNGTVGTIAPPLSWHRLPLPKSHSSPGFPERSDVGSISTCPSFFRGSQCTCSLWRTNCPGKMLASFGVRFGCTCGAVSHGQRFRGPSVVCQGGGVHCSFCGKFSFGDWRHCPALLAEWLLGAQGVPIVLVRDGREREQLSRNSTTT